MRATGSAHLFLLEISSRNDHRPNRKSTNYKVLHFVILSIRMLLRLSSIYLSSSALCAREDVYCDLLDCDAA